MRQYVSAILVIGLLAISDTAAAWPDPCEFSAERRLTVPVTGITRLEIMARAGDLTVRPTDETNIGAAGRACASSAESLEKTQIRTTRDGDIARVFIQVPDEPGDDDGYASLDLAVAVPNGLTVEIIDSSGDIDASSIHLARITDSSGDVETRDTTGDLEVNDSSGDLSFTSVDGALTVTDSSGDVDIDTVRSLRVVRDSSGEIRVSNVSGDVIIENDSSGDIVVSQVGGGVDVVADSTGERTISDVKGSVHVPED